MCHTLPLFPVATPDICPPLPLPGLQEGDLARLPSAVAGLQTAENRANEQLRQLRALQPAALRCGGTCGRWLYQPLLRCALLPAEAEAVSCGADNKKGGALP
jgi:hypothetical protein